LTAALVRPLQKAHPMTNRLYSKSALLAGLCLAAGDLIAQTAPAPNAATLEKYDRNKNGILEPDEIAAQQADTAAVLMLSPFEVRTDQDRGYQAINAGSGGRIDMELRLTPNAMSVLTKEFLEDWNVTSMAESFRYAMNVDPGGFNPTGGPYGDFEFNFRGVGSSGNYPTRNYFLYYGNPDTYNVERLEFSRGPNSVLFGDGQIGGVATTSTKVPRLDRNAYTAAVRFDTWGGMRSTIDANHVIDRMTAVRVNGLYQTRTFGTAWRDNADNYDANIDVALAHAFTPRTKLRGEVEFGRFVRMNMAATYADQMAYYTPGYIFDRTNPNVLTTAQQQQGGVTAVSTNAENWTFIPALASMGLLNTGGATAETRSYRSTGHNYPIQPEGRTDLPGIRTHVRLPSREFNLGANDTESRGKFQVYNLFFDHRFTDNLSGQVSYYNYFNDRGERSNARVGTLQLDLNRYLPNGQLNPKMGVAYGEATPNKGNQFNYVREARGLLTWRGRLPFQGKAQISAILGMREESFRAQGFTLVRIDGANVNFTNAANSIRYRYYVDEPGRYGSRFLPPQSPGFTYGYRQTGFGMIEFKDIKYAQLVTASSFLNDRISLVLGTRYDDMLTDNIQNIGTNPTTGELRFGGYDPVRKATVEGAHNFGKAKPVTSNVGTVAWLDRRQRLGVFYNYSQNFAPPPSGPGKLLGFNADGTLIQGGFGATTGNERSYGVRINLLGGAISGEARYYDSNQVDRVFGGSGNDQSAGTFNALWTNSGPTYGNNTTLTTLQYRDVEALKANGYEFTLIANYKGLRLSTNYALPDTEAVLIRPMVRAYAEKFIPVWEKFAADGRNDKGEALTADNVTQINNQILNLRNNLAGSAPGTRNNGTNKWTGSFNANYSFSREGRLRGLSVGWAISGRGPRKVGTVNPSILFNLPVGTNPTPAQNQAAAFAYLYSTEYYVQDANVSYALRFGKYHWRFQVNILNLWDKDDLIFQNYGAYRELGLNTNPFVGTVNQGFSYLDPRKISFTTTVSF
jgi:outer membrane receptor protein involved in Fe transport